MSTANPEMAIADQVFTDAFAKMVERVSVAATKLNFQIFTRIPDFAESRADKVTTYNSTNWYDDVVSFTELLASLDARMERMEKVIIWSIVHKHKPNLFGMTIKMQLQHVSKSGTDGRPRTEEFLLSMHTFDHISVPKEEEQQQQ